MVGKRFKAPTYNEAVLAGMFKEFLVNGPRKGYKFVPGGDPDLDLHGDQLFMRFYGITQIIHFGNKQVVVNPGDFDIARYAFGVLTPYEAFPGMNVLDPNLPSEEVARLHSGLVDEVQMALDHRLNISMDQRRAPIFRQTFGKPGVYEAALSFRGQGHKGVDCSVTLKGLPRTDNGKMSKVEMMGVVFPHFYNGVVFPAFRAASGNPEMRGAWYS